MKTRENATDALQEPEFTVAEKRENIASKEKMPKILGKIAKFFTDLKTVAFSGKYSDLDGKPAIVNNNTATEAGSALDARQANPTIEGTMANQILQLNNDLSANPISKYFKVSLNVENDSIKNRIFSLQDSGFKCGVFCSNNSCKDNPQTISWYNIFWFGMSSETVIIAGATWEQFLYYGICNNAEGFRDKDIIWKKLSTN